MSVPHYVTSGMGGMRTAGDLVARMEFSKKMKIADAKAYVAKKLDLTVEDLADVTVMREARELQKLGLVTGMPGAPRGIVAKMNIEKVLDIKINSCEAVRRQLGIN